MKNFVWASIAHWCWCFKISQTSLFKKKFDHFEVTKEQKYVKHLDFSHSKRQLFFKKNGPIPVSFCLFLVFSDKHYIFIANQLEKLYCPYSIWPWDSNPWPLKHKPFPITTRPGLPPYKRLLIYLLDLCTSFVWLSMPRLPN